LAAEPDIRVIGGQGQRISYDALQLRESEEAMNVATHGNNAADFGMDGCSNV
jgi:hypothetical protein